MVTIFFIILHIFFATRAVLKIGEYLVNKPLQAASMSADNVAAKRNEHLAEKQSFEGKWEVLRTISQPRTLSADIPASQKEVYLFYNPPINFHFAIKPL